MVWFLEYWENNKQFFYMCEHFEPSWVPALRRSSAPQLHDAGACIIWADATSHPRELVRLSHTGQNLLVLDQ